MPTSDPWDGTTWGITAPDIDQSYGNAYKEIYDLRKGIAIRMNKEHETLATSSAGGVHKQGSARIFFQDAAPTTQVDTSAFDSGDLGLMWCDSNSTIDNEISILTATTPTWTPISTNIIATLLAANRQFAGTLTVDGATTLTGAVGAAAAITLGAGADLIGSTTSDITIGTNKFTVAGDTGNTVIAGTLGVTGNSTYAGTLGITGVATLGDASLLATSAAPTTDAMISNKKYVDDMTKGAAPTTDDSESNALSVAHAYLAQTAGYVGAFTNASSTSAVKGYVGATTNPAGAGQIVQWGEGPTGTVPCIYFYVPNGMYFEVTCGTACTISWTPMKSGGAAPVDQD